MRRLAVAATVLGLLVTLSYAGFKTKLNPHTGRPDYYYIPDNVNTGIFDNNLNDRIDGRAGGTDLNTTGLTGAPYVDNGAWAVDNNAAFMARHWTGSGEFLKYDGTRGDGSGMVYPGAGIAVSTGAAWGTSLAAPTGTIVGTSDSQELSNKTFGAGMTWPTFNQNTAGTAAGIAAAYIDWNAGSGGASILNKPTILSFSDVEGDPAAIGTAADGTSGYSARRDHVHAGDHGALAGLSDDDHPQYQSALLSTPGTDNTATGLQTSAFNAGATIAVGDLCYLDNTSKWVQADANAAGTSTGMLAISLEAKTTGQAMKVALPGTFCRHDAWNWTPGTVLYVDTTAGAITATQPSGADDVIRVVGYALTADVVYFNPAGTWITHL